MAGELSGKSVIVTGAGSGIGKATALVLARMGARLTLADINTNSWPKPPPSSAAPPSPCPAT